MAIANVRTAGSLTCVLAILVALAAPLHAQNTVNLHGRVTDNTGKPLVGAQVTVLSVETNQQRGALTRADGSYNIVGLSPGNYRVTPVMIGYAQDQRNVSLSAGQISALNFALFEEAVAMKAVEATAEREATFEVQRHDVSTPVVTVEIVNLPLNTRNTMNLAAIVPGVKTFAPTAGRSLPAVGSLPDLRFWNFYLDGVEWKSFFNGNLVGIPQTASPLPQEAMREFRVHLNPYDAAFTRGSSFIMSAESQRGTNEMHGSFFGFRQSLGMNAHDLLQRRARDANPNFERADYGRWQAGFNLRGPITQDRTFFSVSYEGQSTDNTLTVNPRSTVWSNFAKDHAAPTVNHTGVVRLTHNVNPLHTADFTYAARYYDSETNFGGAIDRSGGITATYWVHSAQLRDTYTPDANTVNELSLNVLSWSHNEAQMEPGRKTETYPGITFGTNGFPLELKELTFRLVNRFTKSMADGRHLLTAGGEAARVNIDAWLPNNRDGSFGHNVDDPNALPTTASIGMGFLTGTDEDARAKSSGWAVGVYVQDQWSVSRNFLLTLGLRWDAELNTLNNDFESPFADDAVLKNIPMLQNFLVDGDRKNDLNNFAPRMSFSWDVNGNGRTYIRGGAGIMYDRITTFMSFFEKRAAGWRVYNFTNPGTKDPEVLRQRVRDGQGSNLLSLNLMKKDMQVPYNIQTSLGLGQQLAPGLALNLDYIHQDANNLYVQVTPNYRTSSTTRKLTNSFGDITLYDDFGEAKFDAIATSVTYNKPGLRLNGAYTLGWYESTFEGLGGYNDASFFVMQPTTGDERHRVVLSGVGDLPYGFKLSGVFIVATPRPYVAILGQDTNGDLNFNNDFLNGKAERTITPDKSWENMYRTFDLRLAKQLALGGSGKVSVSAEAFNIFNFDNYSAFDGRQRNANGTTRDTFGDFTGVFAARQAQVGLRYEF
ncbi:MAG: carboxypeptidase regulatory-like domain-containing protein [Gemmatimonadota bacterium]